MELVDLKTDSGLKRACREAEGSQVNHEWRAGLREFLEEVANTPQEDREARAFQEMLWNDNPISAVGMGTVNVDHAIDNDGFRRWLAEQSCRELPTDAGARTATLTQLHEEILERLSSLTDRTPHLKMFRVLAALFPLEFTTLSGKNFLRELLIMMFGKGTSAPVAGHAKIRSRLDAILGAPDPANLGAVVERLTLPWMLYALAKDSEPEPTTDPREPGKEKLKPLSAARRRRGLTTIKGSFVEMLSILEFVGDKPTREELLDYLRGANSKAKDSSLKLVANILKSEFGVMRHDGDHYCLTDRGEAVLESGNPDYLRDWLLTRILGVDHVLVALRAGPSDSESLVKLLQGVNPGWTTSYAPSAMLNWLRHLGAIERNTAGLLQLTARGKEWSALVEWDPEILPDEEEDGDTATDPVVIEIEMPELATILDRVRNIEAFPDEVVASLHLGLWANDRRHFAILTGLSGSGKTRLAQVYARAIIGDGPGSGDRLCTLPVQPGWFDPTPLLGYVNPLSGDSYEGTPFLDLLMRASEHPQEPHVVVLDEMNLSHPEQYLAPVLSAMETGAELHLHNKDDNFDGVPRRIPYPSNLVLIGTVNMDETTLGISDKVLDRAFTVEFWTIDLDAWSGWAESGLPKEELDIVRNLLRDLMQALEPARLHFGWRVIDEVVGFMRERGSGDGPLSPSQALDRVIYAKILPKLRGEDAPRFRDALEACEAALERHQLPLSRAKVAELRSDLAALGSARFWR